MKGLYDRLNNADVCENKKAVLDDIMQSKGHAHETFANSFLNDLNNLEDGSCVYSNTG